MFKREMKINLKSFIIWASILILVFLLVFFMYPFMIEGGKMDQLNAMMEIFPEEVLKAFNMDVSSLSSVFGWIKTEGFTFALLIIGSFAGILGSNILLKEENDKTIEYLNMLPVKRRSIVLNKVFAGLIYVILLTIVLGIFNFIGISLSQEFDTYEYFLLSITPIFSSIVIFSLCMFISTFAHKTKKMLGVSLGIVFISYILQVVSQFGDKTEFLKYLSVYTLSDIRNVITNVAINPVFIMISIILTVAFIVLTLIRYERKELV